MTPLLTTKVRLSTSVNNLDTDGVVDTGAARTMVNEDTARSLLGAGYEAVLAHGKTKEFQTANDSPCWGYLLPQVEMSCCALVHNLDLYVLPTLPCPVLLGLDFLAKFELIIDPARKTVFHPSWSQPLLSMTVSNGKKGLPAELLMMPSIEGTVQREGYRVRLVGSQNLAIPPRAEKILIGRVIGLPVEMARGKIAMDAIFTASPSTLGLPNEVMIGHEVTRVNRSSVPVRVVNLGTEEVVLSKNLYLGQLMFNTPESLFSIVSPGEPKVAREDGSKEVFLDKFNWPGNLAAEEVVKLKQLIWDSSDVFSHNNFDLGVFQNVKHDVHTEGPPIRQPLRRQSPHARQQTFQLVKEMLEHGVVTPSTSPWASPVVLVSKPDGKTRFCVDYRRLNDATHKDAYPLPRIDDTLDSLGGGKYFSTLDLTSGYWQIALTPDAAEKSAFPTPFGLFQFTVLPFGMCNAPSTFQRAMECCLAGLQWEQCMVYLDDVIVFSATFSQHLERLGNVFDRFRTSGLKLKPSKCSFAKEEVKYLGHIVSREGIQPDPAKVEAVKNWPIPTCTRDVRSFVGLASYYRKFIQNFAHSAAPLHRLCSTKVPFSWAEAEQISFDKLKQLLITHPVLTYPDFSKPFRLDVDACGVGLGAVLSQVVDGKEHVVAYSSRVLTDCEKRYPITEKEGLALFSGVKNFKHYLYGRTFLLVSDHDPLKYLRRTKDMSDRIWGWVLFLERFNYSVQHRPGNKHVNADALSRLPQGKREVQEKLEACMVAQPRLAAETRTILPPTFEETELMRHQDRDPSLSAIRELLETPQCQREPCAEVKITPFFKHFLKNRREYSLSPQLVQFKGRSAIPQSQVSTVFQLCHDHALAGHLGEDRTRRLIASRFFWPGLDQDVHNYIRTCTACQLRKRNYRKVYSPLQPFETSRLFQRFAIDIVSYPPVLGYSAVLVVIDYSTRWPEAFPLRDQTAATIARVLYNNIICRFGVPEVIHSDRGANFQSSLMSELYTLCGITRTRTTAYHPQGDGLVERQIQTLSDTLSRVGSGRGDWLENLPSVLFALRVTPQASTGYSPYELLYGREPLLPADLQFGYLPVQGKFAHHSIAELQALMRKLREIAWRNIRLAQEKQRQRYDAAHRSGRPFKVGDTVHLAVVHLGRYTKLDENWKGPYRVISNPYPGAYEVEGIADPSDVQVVAQDRLKGCFQRKSPAQLSELSAPEPQLDSSSDEESGKDSRGTDSEDEGEVESLIPRPVPIPPTTEVGDPGIAVESVEISSEVAPAPESNGEPESGVSVVLEEVTQQCSTPVADEIALPDWDVTPIPLPWVEVSSVESGAKESLSGVDQETGSETVESVEDEVEHPSVENEVSVDREISPDLVDSEVVSEGVPNLDGSISSVSGSKSDGLSPPRPVRDLFTELTEAECVADTLGVQPSPIVGGRGSLPLISPEPSVEDNTMGRLGLETTPLPQRSRRPPDYYGVDPSGPTRVQPFRTRAAPDFFGVDQDCST